MTISSKMKNPVTIWQKIFGTSRAHHLVKKAKESGIKQAVVQRVEAGYLQGQKLVFDQVEAAPQNLPLCVELIDDESTLKSFVAQYKDQMDGCRVILFKSAELLS